MELEKLANLRKINNDPNMSICCIDQETPCEGHEHHKEEE